MYSTLNFDPRVDRVLLIFFFFCLNPSNVQQIHRCSNCTTTVNRSKQANQDEDRDSTPLTDSTVCRTNKYPNPLQSNVHRNSSNPQTPQSLQQKCPSTVHSKQDGATTIHWLLRSTASKMRCNSTTSCPRYQNWGSLQTLHKSKNTRVFKSKILHNRVPQSTARCFDVISQKQRRFQFSHSALYHKYFFFFFLFV